MTADSIICELVHQGRYVSLNDAWRTFLRWALVEGQLPESDCRKALAFVAEGGRGTASAAGMAEFEQWFHVFDTRSDVILAMQQWMMAPAQSVPEK